jgi:hypothetical protein
MTFTVTKVCENGNGFHFRGSYSENFFAFSFVRSDRSDIELIKSLKRKYNCLLIFSILHKNLKKVSTYII